MMTNLTRRLWFLLVFLFVGFGAMELLPRSGTRPEPGVAMQLPEYIGAWYGQDVKVSEKESAILGEQTRFVRKLYTNGRGDSIYVSIVVAGEDMSISIHRPERCLPAQGYNILDARTATLPLPSGSLTTSRLHTERPLFTPDGKPVIWKGKSAVEYSLMHYWFIGCKEMTHNHTVRYFLDARDRLFKGCDQPWAYVTVLSRISEGFEKFGRNEAQTDAFMREFMQQLVPAIVKPGVANR